MGFFSEIISDCTNSYSTAGSDVARLSPKKLSPKNDVHTNHLDSTFADKNFIQSNVHEYSFQTEMQQDQVTQNSVKQQINQQDKADFNDVAELDEGFDLAAELHRVQAERLHMQSRARSNVPCSEESQVISQIGGDSDEHLHDDNVNRSSIDQKQKSDAEKVRDRMFDSEFFESSSDVREFDEDVNYSRYDSDESFYDRKVELKTDQISSRESRFSTEVEDINLRNSQGQRAQPGRLQQENTQSHLNVIKDAISEVGNIADHKPKEHGAENISFLDHPDSNQTEPVSKKETKSKIDSNSTDINQIYSELKSAVDIISMDREHGRSESRSQEVAEQPSYLRSVSESSNLENRNKPSLKPSFKQNRKHDPKNNQLNSNSSKNAGFQPEVTPKVTIGQIDVLVTASPDAKTDAVDARSSGFSSPSFSNSTSSASKSYSRRI